MNGHENLNQASPDSSVTEPRAAGINLSLKMRVRQLLKGVGIGFTMILLCSLADFVSAAETDLLLLQNQSVPQMGPPLPLIAGICEEPILAVGLTKQLLVDDYVISHRHNIHRDLNQATKAKDAKAVLVLDKPWEEATVTQVGSVWREGGQFHMRYTGRSGFSCAANSEDGLHWTKSNLGFHEFQGSKENDLLSHMGLICFIDSHEPDPAHKYKAAYSPSTAKYAGNGDCLAHSADGPQWQDYNSGKAVTFRAADTMNQPVWDERALVYRLFTRTDFGARGGNTEYRVKREVVNPDVKANPTNWTVVRSWKFDREGAEEVRRRQVHTLTRWRYGGIDFGMMIVMEWPAFNIPQVQVGHDQRRHERDVCDAKLYAFQVTSARIGL